MTGGIAGDSRARRRGRWIAVTATVLAGAAVAAVGPGASAATPGRACRSPYPPLVDTASPASPVVPTFAGSNAARPIIPVNPLSLDTDGDGRPDTVGTVPHDPNSVQITSRHGVTRFVRAGVALAYGGSLGDLDGDGHDEFTIVAPTPDSHTADDDEYLIPGTVAPGTYDPAAVGIRIPTGETVAVPDRTGDGAPDLVQSDIQGDSAFPGITRVLSGAAVLATAPGGSAPASAVVQRIGGFPSALADLGDGKPPAIITGDVLPRFDQNQPQHLLLRIVPAAGAITELASSSYFPAEPGSGGFDPLGSVDVRVTDAGTFLLLTEIGMRGGGERYVWRLDDPCGSLPTAATTTTTTSAPPVEGSGPPVASPAVAVHQPATFTG